nr:polysaccharide deacetylase family protein [Sporosarcina sp. E16_8]
MNTLEKYLLNRINLPGKVVVITMDDGLKSNVVYAAPILRKYGFKANIFLITSRVKEHDQSWNADTIVSVSTHEMEANKDVFAYHGHTHDMHYFNGRLSAMNFLPYDEALADLKRNKNFLAKNGFNTTHFAYPIGSNFLQSQSLLIDSGFTTAFTTRKGYNKVGDNPLLFKR